MFDDRRLARSLALVLAAGSAVGGIGAGARCETRLSKPHSTRKIFDLTPPHQGEMLANPSRGSGAPPQLKEFAPTSAMHMAQDEAADATSGASDGKSSAGNGDAGKFSSAPRPLAAGPLVEPSDLQMQLTDEIAKLGIDGFLARPPQGASPQEQQYWGAVRGQIAASLATWQALYSLSPEPKDGSAPVAQGATGGANP